MKLINHTRHKIPLKWLKRIVASLDIEPTIEIYYADEPVKGKIPNYKHNFDGKYYALDGVFLPKNRVILYCGKWGVFLPNALEHKSVQTSKKNSLFFDYTTDYIRWILLHELRHNYLDKHNLLEGISTKREEQACSRYANLIMGVRRRDELIRYKKECQK